MKKIKKLWRFLTSPEMILYIVFGVLTTLINIVVFDRCFHALHWTWQAANAAAWILAVLFAFVTNKFWVFQSKSMAASVLLRELVSFFAARLLSLGVDYACMWLLIEIAGWNALLAKIIDNVIVVVMNYVLSKLIIFRKK